MTETKIITIAGEQFKVPLRYAEGSILTAHEARALNQTLHEAIRNNNAKKIKEAKEQAEATSTEFDIKAAQKLITAYAEDYDFSSARTPATIVDPVDKRAMKLATEAIKAALRAKGKYADYFGKNASEENKSTVKNRIEEVAQTNDKIRAEAKRQVDDETSRAENVASTLGL